MTQAPDPLYVQARRVLLDVLDALAPHRDAIIVAGAQAVYLHTGQGDLAIAPYTTDGDLALDPTLLGDNPKLAEAMAGAGFRLLIAESGSEEPGIWVASATIGGETVTVPVDLIVPEGVATGGGRRGARLGPHGKKAARRVPGLEAALVDHSSMTITALDPVDSRRVDVKVAGPAALFVAKAHKIGDRLAEATARRANDKDGVDVYRLMQTTRPDVVGMTLARLRDHPTAGPPTRAALEHLATLFGSQRGASGAGIAMVARALAVDLSEERIAGLCIAYTERLIATARK